MEERSRKLRLLEGARRIARAHWAAPAGALGLLSAGSASPRLWIQRLRSAAHMLPSSDRGRSTSRVHPPPSSTFRIVRLRSTPRRSHLPWARACGAGWRGPALSLRDGLPLRVFSVRPRLIMQHALVRVQQAAGVSLGF